MKDRLNFGRSFAAGLALACIAAPGLAEADVKDGVDAWSRGDYPAAIREWQGPADAGDPDALFNLAQAYKLGRGVKADLARAQELFGKAAARGHLQAADNYGLLLFQSGEHARAMPYIKAAAGRGDPRAQYLLGIARFNGENVEKDWVRAYALVSLAQQAGLPQAAAALAQMDQYIPIEQRQQSVVVASSLAAETQAARARQIAASDLGVQDPSARPVLPNPRVVNPDQSMGQPGVREAAVTPEMAASAAAYERSSRASAGADYTRPKVPAVAGILDQASARRPEPAPQAVITAAPRRTASAPPPPRVAAPPAPAPGGASATAGGNWRVQLGAFGVPGNADRLWEKVRGRPELAGHPRRNEPAGRLIKLQATGFASQTEASAACARLTAAGLACIPVRN